MPDEISRRMLLGGLAAVSAAAQLRAATSFATDKSASFDAAIARMIKRGEARQLALRKAFPFGKSDGSSPYVVSIRHGALLDLKGDAEVRAAAIGRETAALRAEAARGIYPPGFAIDQTIAAQSSALPPSGPVRQAMLRQIAALGDMRAKSPDGAGVWRLPGGADYYRLRLRCTTGTDLSPSQIDRKISAAIAMLSARADRLLQQAGLASGDIGARLREFRKRSPLYTNDDAGRDAAILAMGRAIDRVRPHLPSWFNPPFEARSSVRRMTPSDERAGKRGYRNPAIGGAPGVYFPDLSAVRDRPSWTLATVAFHETVPGHLLQAGRQGLLAPPPSALQLRHAPGYGEGWAIYAESLVDRIGLLSPAEQLGFLQSWLFRMARVRADIGIHVHRWTRAQAIRFLEQTVGFELFFPFAVEVDRYCIEPASFAGDALFALALRDAAPTSPLAARDFHDLVLNRGPLSIEALAEVRRAPANTRR